MPTKKKPTKPPARTTKLDAQPDYGTAPDPDNAVSMASDALFRFLFHKEFPEKPTPSLVRFLAMLVYTTDPTAPTMNDVVALPFFAQHASLEKLIRWSAEDGWASRREKTWDTWHQRVVDASAAAYVAFRTSALADLSKLRANLMKKLDDKVASATFGDDSKTHELIRALTMVLKQESELQVQASPTTRETAPAKSVDGRVIEGQLGAPGATTDPITDPLESKMSVDEMRAAAHAVMEFRRAQMLEAASAPATPTKP